MLPRKKRAGQGLSQRCTPHSWMDVALGQPDSSGPPRPALGLHRPSVAGQSVNFKGRS